MPGSWWIFLPEYDLGSIFIGVKLVYNHSDYLHQLRYGVPRCPFNYGHSTVAGTAPPITGARGDGGMGEWKGGSQDDSRLLTVDDDLL